MSKQVISLFLLGFLAAAQAGWIKTYGKHVANYGSWVEQTSDGGYIIAGQDNDTTHNLLTTKPFGSSLILIRTDSSGDTLWTKSYRDFPGSVSAWGRCIQKTADGGYVAAGNASGYAWLVKFDAAGDTSWCNIYNKGDYQSSEAYCVRETNNGYTVTGNLQLWNTNALLMLCYDSLGDTLWSRSYYKEDKSQGGGMGFSLQPTSNGGFIVTGSGPANGLWILKTDSLGDTLWSRLYVLGDPSKGDEGRSIEPTSDGGWIITGAVDYAVAKYGALLLMKIDSLGDTLWTKVYDYGGSDDHGNSVKQTNDGGYVVVGTKNYSEIPEGGSIWLLKTDAAGDTLWTRTYGGKPQDRGNCIQLTPDGGYIITGFTTTYSADGSTKVLLMKLDSLGLLGITDGPLSYALAGWELSNPLGKEVSLRFSDFPQGFHASVYDASGRKVDEMHSTLSSGTIVWGECYGPGVYFIRTDKMKTSAKVVIVK